MDLCVRCLNQRMKEVIAINHKIVPMLGLRGFWECSGKWGAGKTLRHGSINMITNRSRVSCMIPMIAILGHHGIRRTRPSLEVQ